MGSDTITIIRLKAYQLLRGSELFLTVNSKRTLTFDFASWPPSGAVNDVYILFLKDSNSSTLSHQAGLFLMWTSPEVLCSQSGPWRQSACLGT